MNVSNRTIMAAAAVIVVVLVGVFLLTNSSTSSPTGTTQSQSQNSNSTIALMLTDPPLVPSGTTALVINYSSIGVQVSNVQHSGWIYSNSSGRIDLLSLLNLSQTIGTLSVSSNASIQSVEFNVASATITVNGTSYNVTIPSGKVIAHVQGVSPVNGNSSILLSLSPTVATILTANSTIFVMVPSLRAVMVPGGANSTSTRLGYIAKLNSTDKLELSGTKLNVSLSGVVLKSSGNVTSLSVTVKNYDNQSVVIRHLAILGNVSASINSTRIDQRSAELGTQLGDAIRGNQNCTSITSNTLLNLSINDRTNLNVNISANVSEGAGHSNNDIGAVNGTANTSVSQGSNNEGSTNSTRDNSSHSEVNNSDFGSAGRNMSDYKVQLNDSVCTNPGFAQVQAELKDRMQNISSQQSMHQMHFKLISFAVFQNGTIGLPSSVEDFNNSGYQLGAGQSVTFNFTGTMLQGDGNLVLSLSNGSTYQVVAKGEEGLYAAANATAT